MELEELASGPGAEDASQHKHLKMLRNHVAECGLISHEEVARHCASPSYLCC